MNNSDGREKTTDSGGDFNSIDYVNLKIAMRPVKFYKLIHSEKSKIHEYTYIIRKIKEIKSSNDYLIIYLKCNSRDEIQISNEEEWNKFFEFSNKSILELIDSKNTLKIEFSYSKNACVDQDEILEKNYFIEKEKIGYEVLKSVFMNALKNEKFKIKIKEDILSSENKNELEKSINSKNFDFMLKNLFENTLEKIQNLSLIKNSLVNESDFDTDNFIEAEEGLDIPTFSEFYKNEHIENYRSKILSENFSESKMKNLN